LHGWNLILTQKKEKRMRRCLILVAAFMLFATNAFAGDSLSDALTKGDFKGHVTFLYLTGSDTDVAAARATDDKNTGSIAVGLDYLTGDFYGFKLGIGIQSGWDLNFHDEDDSIEDDTRNSITAASFNEAFLSYSMKKASIKVGRQFIKSPLLMNSSVFPLKDSFDAVQFTTTILPKTTIKGFYVNQWNKRYGTDSNGSVVQEDAKYSDGLYSFYAKNKSVPGLTLDGQYLTTDENSNNGDMPVVTKGGYNQYFVRGQYKLPIDLPLFFGAETGGASFDNASEQDASFYGFKVGTKLSGADLSFAYTLMDDDNDYPGTLGHVPDIVLYTNGLMNKSIYAGVEAVSFQIKHDFGIKDFSASLKLIHIDQSDEGMTHSSKNIYEANEINLDFGYAFSGILKGLSTRVLIGYADYDQNVDEDTNLYGRLYLTYSF
jgi:hypothetical protein